MAHDEDVLESGEPVRAEDGYTRWVVGVVGAGIIAMLAWLLTADRASIEGRLENQRSFAAETSNLLAVHEYRISEQAARSQRIEEKLDIILERLPKR